MEEPNLNYIKQLSEGDITFEESIINVLKKEFPEELLLFNTNYADENFSEAANNVHKLKHKVSILGLTNDLKLSSNFENDLRKGDLKLYEDFVNVLNKIHVYLDNI